MWTDLDRATEYIFKVNSRVQSQPRIRCHLFYKEQLGGHTLPVTPVLVYAQRSVEGKESRGCLAEGD